MEKLLALALALSCSAVAAQTPATNPMPDGSRDMYVGLGAVSAPRYEGAGSRKVSALPVLQIEWSSGLFISGMSAGMHLSSQPSVEFGPLLTLQPRRSESGTGRGADGLELAIVPTVIPLLPSIAGRGQAGNRLAGMDPIGARLQLGGFFNYYLAPDWRVTSSLLYGAGNERDGARLALGVQRVAAGLGTHHRVSLSAGVTLANRHYNAAFFGVSQADAIRSGNNMYSASGGLSDAQLGARWNWAVSPAWLLTSSLQATRLLGSAKDSPLVERPTNLTVSTAIAYRF